VSGHPVITMMKILITGIQLIQTDQSINKTDGVSNSKSTNLDVARVGPEQFAREQQTEISVNVSLVNLHTASPIPLITKTIIRCQVDDH